jgi:hypothetical protein
MMFIEQPIHFAFAPRRDCYAYGCRPVYSRIQYEPAYYPQYREVVYYEPEPVRVYGQRRQRVKPLAQRNLVNELDLTLHLFQSLLGSLEGSPRHEECMYARQPKKARHEGRKTNMSSNSNEREKGAEDTLEQPGSPSCREPTKEVPKVYRIPIVDHNEQDRVKDMKVAEDTSDNESVRSGSSAESTLSMIEQLRARTQSEALITETPIQEEEDGNGSFPEQSSFRIEIQTEEIEEDAQSVHSDKSQKSELSMLEQLKQRNSSDSILEELPLQQEEGWELADLEKQTEQAQ